MRRLLPRRAGYTPLAVLGRPLRVAIDRSDKRVADRERPLEAKQGSLSCMYVCTFRGSRLMGCSCSSGALPTRWSVRTVSPGGACGAGDTSEASAPGTHGLARDGADRAKNRKPPQNPASSPLTDFSHARTTPVNLGSPSCWSADWFWAVTLLLNGWVVGPIQGRYNASRSQANQAAQIQVGHGGLSHDNLSSMRPTDVNVGQGCFHWAMSSLPRRCNSG